MQRACQSAALERRLWRQVEVVIDRITKWIGRIVFTSGLAIALAFGAGQALASGSGLELCEGTCPNEKACDTCCVEHGGSGGACFLDYCICEG